MKCMLIGIVTAFLNPTTVQQALASDHVLKWWVAMDVDYDSLVKKVMWELVSRPKLTKQKRMNILTSGWVLDIKRKEKGQIKIFKARFAIRGFLQKVWHRLPDNAFTSCED